MNERNDSDAVNIVPGESRTRTLLTAISNKYYQMVNGLSHVFVWPKDSVDTKNI